LQPKNRAKIKSHLAKTSHDNRFSSAAQAKRDTFLIMTLAAHFTDNVSIRVEQQRGTPVEGVAIKIVKSNALSASPLPTAQLSE
jgi:hypothetical protein